MKSLLVAYGTQEGHTAEVAGFIGGIARDAGYGAEVRRCRDLPPGFALAGYSGIVVAAPMHSQKYEASVLDFVRQHGADLEVFPSAFLSVGLVPTLPAFLRNKAAAGVIANLVKETGWRPARVLMVAGALRYREYRPRVRLAMRLFMALLGGPTNTSRNHVLTDWGAVKRFTGEFLASVSQIRGE